MLGATADLDSLLFKRKPGSTVRLGPGDREHGADLLGSAAFSKLGKETRETFLEALTQIIADAPMTVVAVEIDKRRLALAPRVPAGCP